MIDWSPTMKAHLEKMQKENPERLEEARAWARDLLSRPEDWDIRDFEIDVDKAP